MSSILTNTAAMAALQTLRSINNSLETTQGRVSSGMRVETAADNSAYWSIATTMRSDNKALSTVQDALGLGAAKVDTAYTGMNAAIEVVDEIKAKIVASREPGVDRTKVQKEISELQAQLYAIVESASFSGENWLSGDITNATGNVIEKSVVGSFTRDANGNVSVTSLVYEINANTALIDFDGTDYGTDSLLTVESTVTASEAFTAANGVAVAVGDAFTILTLDITRIEFDPATETVDDQLDLLMSFVDERLQSMTDAASSLGAINKRISMQEDFVATLMDSIDKGVGRLVDADMNEESTRLKALQTQQQLGIQALSIANTQSQNILQLFQS
jgi:flagellin